MKKKKTIVAVIAAYNEESKIKKVIAEVAKYVDRIIVVDDGSGDNTVLKAKHRKAIVLKHIINLGQGAALQTGFDYAKKIKADIVLTYDADGQFKASEIPLMIAPLVKGKADVSLGSRFLGHTTNMPVMRYVVLSLGLLFTRIFSNIRLTDTHNGFRAFTSQALAKMEIVHNRWAHPSDIIYQIAANKFKVVEIPVTVYYTNYSWKKGQRNIEAVKIPFQLIGKALLGL
jgi:polyprenyl-phospho-N-acetylgalactosaminyl synthase